MLEQAAARARREVGRLAARGLLAFLGGLLLFAAAVLLLIVAYGLLADRFGPILAAAFTAALLIILGLLLLLLAGRVARERAIEVPVDQAIFPIGEEPEALARRAGRSLSPLAHPLVRAAGLGLLAGLLLGRRSRRKKRRKR